LPQGRRYAGRCLSLPNEVVEKGAVLLTRLLRTLLFEVSTTDPPTYVLATLVFGAAAALASWIPARRAARVDPLETLRTE
jgi:ABC-type lipoprotein release transport system permease subunit